MKAVIVRAEGGPENLAIEQVLDPVPGAEDILIRTHGVGLNNADLLQRRGLYPPPQGASPLMGLEVSGEVIATGANVTRWKKGDRVMALLAGGGYAEQVAVHERLAMPLPDGLDYVAAAGIPEAFLTAWLELVTLGEIKAGDAVLIHAGASGVGTAAIQIVKALGAKAYITAGSSEKIQRCLELGADLGINYKTESFDARILAETEGAGVNCILDLVGASHWEKNIRSLGIGGKLLLVGLGGGRKAELDLGPLLSKRITVIGSTLRSRPLHEKAALVEDFTRRAIPLFTEGKLKPIIDQSFAFDQVIDAHRYIEKQTNFGKVVLTL
ncbi:MAG: NAD(P)H-quinone oxidoreductase [Bdellovibrionia bacterium]